jgi:AcrR family transcriptional regulator
MAICIGATTWGSYGIGIALLLSLPYPDVMDTNDRLSPETALGRLPPGARREQIIAAASSLFAERGYHGASMQDVGERVGMLKGSLYAHVANKEEMLLEIVSTTSRRFIDALTPVLTGDDQVSLRIRLGLRTHLGVIHTDPDAARVFMHEGRHLEGRPRLWIEEAHNRYERIWRQAFEDGVRLAEFRHDLDTTAATLLALSVGNWITTRQGQVGDITNDIADSFSSVLLAGCLV